jgi:ribonuclease J
MNDKKLRIIPLGGLGEVGKNMMAYEYGENILVVDAGLMFPDNDMLGIDYIIPDFQYLLEKRDKVRGIIFTHGHEDHTGAARHVLEQLNVPLYATPLTRGLLEVKLSRGGLLSQTQINTVHAGETVHIGPFQVELFHVCHSIPDGVGLGITTPAGLVVHTGDYKFDHTPVDNWPTDFAKLADFSGRGVLALLADSTNSTRPGWTPSESVIDPAFDAVFREANDRIIIASFASLVSRMQQVTNAAVRHGRKLAFAGLSMVENAKIARNLGYLEIPDDVLVPIDQALKMKSNKVVLMCTGTQGEPTSIMGRLSKGTNRQFDLLPSDTVILSSHPIPGNEESINRTINRLLRRGAKVIYESIAPVHVSGHASQEEMKLLLNLVRPKFFIPVHGELRHLQQHAALARQVGIPDENIAVVENGTIIELQKNNMRVSERIPGGYIFVDGTRVGDVGPSVLREREMLARDGFVLVNLTLDKETTKLVEKPEIITRGFIYERDSSDLLDDLSHKVVKAVEHSSNGKIQDELEQMVRSYLFSRTQSRPMVFISISQVELD